MTSCILLRCSVIAAQLEFASWLLTVAAINYAVSYTYCSQCCYQTPRLGLSSEASLGGEFSSSSYVLLTRPLLTLRCYNTVSRAANHSAVHEWNQVPLLGRPPVALAGDIWDGSRGDRTAGINANACQLAAGRHCRSQLQLGQQAGGRLIRSPTVRPLANVNSVRTMRHSDGQ
jgi:hypothetical protein